MKELLVILLIIILLVFVILGVHIWRAAIQVAVYKRQGVEMSTWEVLMGAKPVERALIQPKGE